MSNMFKIIVIASLFIFTSLFGFLAHAAREVHATVIRTPATARTVVRTGPTVRTVRVVPSATMTGATTVRTITSPNVRVVRTQPNIRFYSNDRNTIVRYFNANPYRGPRISGNIVVGRAIPQGYVRYSVPRRLYRTLRYYPGYSYYMVNNCVVLISRMTGVI